MVDDNNILLGRITIDDVVDIIREQAEHQALGAAGLDEDEDLFSPVKRATRRRAAVADASTSAPRSSPRAVVGQFQGTIAHIVALAVLMPIVAGMGGNAGTQVLALVVRGLALGQLGASNLQRADLEGNPRRAAQRRRAGHAARRHRRGCGSANGRWRW